MAGLKGPGAAGGSGAVTHGLPARHSRPCLGHPVPPWHCILPGRAGLCAPLAMRLELSPGTLVTAGDSNGTASLEPGVG